MSDKRHEHTETPDAINRLDAFWKRNQKIITYVAVGLVVVVGGWYAYNQYVVKPKEEKAQETVYVAEEYFRADSWQKALNGDSVSKGFLHVIKNYGGTATGNLAKYYAGICYLRLEDYDNAIKYLEDFDTDSKPVQANAWARLADAYSMKGNKSKAVDLYKKAGRHFEEEEEGSAENLFRAAQLLETENKTKEALELYKELKEKYPRTERGGQADRYIYRIEVQPNEFSID